MKQCGAFLNPSISFKNQKRSELKMIKYLSQNNEYIKIKIAIFIALAQTHMIENVKKISRKNLKKKMTCSSCYKVNATKNIFWSANHCEEVLIFLLKYQFMKIFLMIATLMFDNLQRKKVL